MPRKRTEQPERRIEESKKGRVYWRPGQPHPLDALGDENQALLKEIPETISTLLAETTTTEERLHQLLTQSSNSKMHPAQAESLTRKIIFHRFSDRKHIDHLQMILGIIRRRRLIGRLKTIQAALQLINGLLEEEETIEQEFLKAYEKAQNDGPHQPESHANQRLQNIDEPLEELVGSVAQSRQLLRDFTEKLPSLRRDLLARSGWFEVFYVPHKKTKKEAFDYYHAMKAFRKRGIPIPEEIKRAIHPGVAALIEQGVPEIPKELQEYAYDITQLGPYVRYRWREDKNVYQVSLGLEDDYPPFPFNPGDERQ